MTNLRRKCHKICMNLAGRTKKWKITLVAAVVASLFFLHGPLSAKLAGLDLDKLWLEYAPRLCKIPDTQGNIDTNRGRENKKILLWTYMWSSRTWYQPLGQQTFLQCPEKRCELIADRCLQQVADAVLFHWLHLFLPGLPEHHPSWQTWVVTVFESEVTYDSPAVGSASDLDGKINWTISHRFDSEIFMPYDYFLKITDERNNSLQPVVPTTTPQLSMTAKAKSLLKNYKINSDSDIFTIPAVPNINYAQKKQKFALWFVSNCHTKGSFKRLRLFQELRKYIPIDVYGHSSQCTEYQVKKDPCEGLDSDCSTKLMFTYKFYLSFENSECNYYITEKFFKPLRVGTVPVAFGAPLQHYESMAPENSFLHVRNFSSVKHLADYMIYLDQNDDIYNRYFKWKESHVAPKNYNFETDFYCKLCEDLWNSAKKPQVYHNFSNWWNKNKNCILQYNVEPGSATVRGMELNSNISHGESIQKT